MPNKPTPPAAKKSLGERLYGDDIAKKRAKEISENAGKAKTPVFPGASTLRTPSYTSTPSTRRSMFRT